VTVVPDEVVVVVVTLLIVSVALDVLVVELVRVEEYVVLVVPVRVL